MPGGGQRTGSACGNTIVHTGRSAGNGGSRGSVEPDLTKVPSFATFAHQRVRCPSCRSKRFESCVNGDGGLLDVCLGCGRARPVGRYYTDPSIGPRTGSTWSAAG